MKSSQDSHPAFRPLPFLCRISVFGFGILDGGIHVRLPRGAREIANSFGDVADALNADVHRCLFI